MYKKILISIGTRPEAIKLIPIILDLNKDSYFSVDVCLTGQHAEMVDKIITDFKINAKYRLNVINESKNLTELTANIIIKLGKIIESNNYDAIIVHGDTITTIASSLAAYYLKLKIIHVEAGLRTHNFDSPWPEEMNRVLTSKLAALNLAPTEAARRNLVNEGVDANRIYVTGNTVIDCLMKTRNKILNDRKLHIIIENKFNFINLNKKIILVTCHRRENFGVGFTEICNALLKLSKRVDVEIVFPVHLNPAVQNAFVSKLSNNNNIHLIPPQEYFEFVYLMQISYLILTDSGGIQEEAPSLGKPVLVLRDNTERPEGVDAGTLKIVGTKGSSIYSQTSQLLDDKLSYLKMANAANPYGDGKASVRIINILKTFNE